PIVDFVRLTPQAVVSTRPLRGPYQVAIADGYTVTCAWPIAAAGVARVWLVLPTAARSVKRPLRPGRHRTANRPAGSAVAWAVSAQAQASMKCRRANLMSVFLPTG